MPKKTLSHTSLYQEEEKKISKKEECLLNERVLQIQVNYRDFSMTMQTPGAERYLVRGLLFAEKINRKNFLDYQQEEHPHGTLVKVQIEKTDFSKAERRLLSTAACGVCGKKNMEAMFAALPIVKKEGHINATLIQSYYKEIATHQRLFQLTGGCHAASAIDITGNIICVFEDIGRHNAVDKVIGFLLEENCLDKAQILTVSGRVSYEIIQKCTEANIPILSAISAPSALAVQCAEKANITLAAFCRQNRATFYSGFHRIAEKEKII